MKHKKNILLIILIITSLGLILLPKFVKGSIADIDYTFEREILYEQNDPPYDNNFNIVDNITFYTELYNASYSFTNETNGSVPNGWTDTSDADCVVRINNSIDGHNKVIEMYDDNIAGRSRLEYDFADAQTSGTIEWWWRMDDTFKNSYVIWRNEIAGNGLIFRMLNDILYRHDGGYIAIRAVSDNTWYHLRLDFECGGGGYLGLASDTYFLTVNGIQYGAFAFTSVSTTIDNLISYGADADTDYNTYFDAFGYSWLSNYSINDNIIPVIQVDNSIKQIKGYEFYYEGITNPLDTGDTNPESWDSWGTGSGQIVIDVNDVNDRVYRMESTGVQQSGLDKDDLNITGTFVNITFSLNCSVYTLNADQFYFEIYSDAHQLLTLKIYKVGGILKFGYLDGGTTQLYSGMNLNDIYDFNVLINFEIDRAFIILNENNINIGYYNTPLLREGESTVYEIIPYTQTTAGNTMIVDIDYIALFNNGTSIVENGTSYGQVLISLNPYFSNLYPLLSIKAEGLISIYSRIFHGILFGNQTDHFEIESFRNHDDILSTYYEYFSWAYAHPYINSWLVIYLKDSFSYSFVSIEGASLNQGSNKYWLDFDHSGVNIDESYFYVDTNNKLQFTHIANDGSTEYIQATFDIDDVLTHERSISFKGAIIDNGYGYLAINFDPIGSNIHDISTFEKTTRSLITQNRSITDITILITDNDQDDVSGLTSGFVSQISFLSITGIGITIITSGLLDMMIPLILILIPTLLLSSKFGKKFIIPLFLVFSVLLTATSVIPVWVFFIIAYGCGLFIMLNKRFVD